MLRLSGSFSALVVLSLLASCGTSTSPEDAAASPDTGPTAIDAGRTDAARTCTADADCDDGAFCNGAERCTAGACVAGAAACATGQRCNEALDRCSADCTSAPDGDADGVDSMACGGRDCDDADPNRFPGNTEVCDALGRDEDCNPTTLAGATGDSDGDGVPSAGCCYATPAGPLVCGTDCDDTQFGVRPGAIEVCNGIDDDCDGRINGPGEDADGDGFFNDACAGAAGTDCDDSDPRTHVGAPELCDGRDNDCSIAGVRSRVAGGEPAEDMDGDRHLRIGATCDATPGTPGLLPLDDCDDAQASTNPQATEVCNGRDDDCDGMTDEGTLVQVWPDVDRDGFGARTGASTMVCAIAAGLAANMTDCNDAASDVNPSATELCNGRDDDCDGTIDEGTPSHYLDVDGDGYGTTIVPPTVACAAPPGTVTRSGDCDDLRADVLPGQTEICNGADDDCDGVIDESPTSNTRAAGCAVQSASVGMDHTCVRFADGRLACFGNNSNGQTGLDGAAPSRSVSVNGPVAPTQIAAGGRLSCALQADGRVYCFGARASLGAERFDRQDPAARLIANVAGATQVSVGDAHACAIVAPGSVTCWGDREWAQVDGVTATQDMTADATPVGGGITDATKLSAGYRHSCVRRASGRVACWGQNYLGSNGFATGSTPRDVPGLVDALDVAAGSAFTCVVRATGTVECFGENGAGVLGVPATTTMGGEARRTIPGITTATAVGAGLGHACALLRDRTMRCWGFGTSGQLGDGGTTSSATPVDPGVSGVRALYVGGSRTCALTDSGLQCWGNGMSFAQGSGKTRNEVYPGLVSFVAFMQGYATGDRNTCAMLPDTNLWCAGDNSLGERPGAPIGWWQQINPATPTVSVTSSDRHTCWALDSGAVRCSNGMWSLGMGNGYGATGVQNPDGSVRGITTATRITSGQYHTCVIRADRTVWCWGRGTNGQAGPALTADTNTTPAAVTGITDVLELDAGLDHTCALDARGAVRCWGASSLGQTGAVATSQPAPRTVTLPRPALDVASGGNTSCAVLNDGSAWCWGSNDVGQLARPAGPGANPTPMRAFTLDSLVQVAVGSRHTCARQSTGTVYCWGAGTAGELGNGGTVNSSVPVAVTGLDDAMSLACGNTACCATRRSGQTVCWGNRATFDDASGSASVPESPTIFFRP